MYPIVVQKIPYTFIFICLKNMRNIETNVHHKEQQNNKRK